MGIRNLRPISVMKSALVDAKRQMDKDQFGEKAKARKRRVTKPEDENLLWGDNLELEEDDPTVHEIFQAMTRSDRPGLNVVCLHRNIDQLYLDPADMSTVYNPTEPLSGHMIRDLARQVVTIRRPDIEKCLLTEPTDAQTRTILMSWRRIAALRYHRVVIFDHGVCHLKGTPYVLQLSKENQLGLQISKEER